MKKQIALIALAAAALVAAPASTHAQDASATNSASAAPKKHGKAVHGMVSSVDTTANTVTVGTKTYNITADTKITKNGQSATITDITVGENVSITAKKGEGDKLNATAIHIGGAKKKKKSE